MNNTCTKFTKKKNYFKTAIIDYLSSLESNSTYLMGRSTDNSSLIDNEAFEFLDYIFENKTINCTFPNGTLSNYNNCTFVNDNSTNPGALVNIILQEIVHKYNVPFRIWFPRLLLGMGVIFLFALSLLAIVAIFAVIVKICVTKVKRSAHIKRHWDTRIPEHQLEKDRLF